MAEEIKKLDLVSKEAQAAADKTAESKVEKVDLRDKALQEQKSAAAEAISKANDNLKIWEAKFNPEMQTYLEQYFAGSINRFDQDKDGKIDKKEADEFATAMKSKIGVIIKENMPDEKAKSAKEKVDKAASAVETPDLTKKNLESVRELGDQLEFSQSLSEFQTLQTQNNSFQQSIVNQIKEVETFYGQLQTFQSSMQGFNTVKNFYKTITFQGDQLKAKEDLIKSQLAATKASAEAKLADLKTKKTILDKNADRIQASIKAERERLIKDRDEKMAEIDKQKELQSDEIAARKKKFKELSDKQADLEKQKTSLVGRVEKTDDFRKQWDADQKAQKLDTKKVAEEQSKKDAETELEALKLIAADPSLTPQAQEQIAKEIAAAEKRLSHSSTNLELIEKSTKEGKKIDDNLSDEQKAATAELQSVDSYLNGQVKPASIACESNIARLEELKLQYATQSVEVKNFYDKKIDTIDKASESVAEFALGSAISRNQSLDGLSSAVSSLSKIDIGSDSALNHLNPFRVAQGVLHGIGEGFHDLGKFIDKNTGYVLDNTTGGWHWLTQTAGLFTGFLSGGCELVGGIYTMAAHPWETAKSMRALIGRDMETGEWSIKAAAKNWGNMLSGLVGGDEWNKKHYGTSVGKTVFNVLSMFVGAGEAGAAAKGASAAAKTASSAGKAARLAKIESVLAKGGTPGFLTGRGAQIAEIAKFTVGRPFKAAGEVLQTAKKEAGYVKGTFNTAKTFTKTLIYEASPKFVKSAFDAADKVPGLLKKPATFGWEIAKSAGRGALSVAKVGVNVYKELLILPYTILKGTGKILRGEGIAFASNAHKADLAAEVISKEGAQYSKARTRLQEIIQEDQKLAAQMAEPISKEAISQYIKANPELDLMHAKGGKFATEAEATAAENIQNARARMFEAEATKKLAMENPDLASSYLNVKQATEELQALTKENLTAAKKAADKVLANPQTIVDAAEYSALKTAKEKATPGTPAYKEADAALSKFEKSDNPAFQRAKDFEAAEALKADLEKTLKEQKQLFDEFTGQSHQSLTKLESEVAEARRPDSLNKEKSYSDHLYSEYEKALKSGKPDEITKATEAFGYVDPASDLGKRLLAIEEKVSHKVAVLDSEIAALHEARIKNMESNSAAHAEFNQALGVTETRTAEEAAMTGLPQFEYNGTKIAEIKKQNPALREAFEQLEKRQSFLRHHNEINHQLTAIRLRSEITIASDAKLQKVADNLIDQYKNTKKELAISSKDRLIKKVTIEGAEYEVKLKYNGEVRLYDDAGKMVKTSAEVAEEARLAKEASKVKAAPTPVNAPTATPATQPVLTIDKQLTVLDDASLSKQAENSTVAYGTKSPNGDWVEVTRLPNNEYRVVEVHQGKLAQEKIVTDLKLAQEGGEYVFRGKYQGAAYEYKNIREIFNPETSGGKFVTEPKIAPQPAQSPGVAPTASPSTAPTVTPSATPKSKPTWSEAQASMKKAEVDYRNAKVELEAEMEGLSKAYKRKAEAEIRNYPENVIKVLEEDITKAQGKVDSAKSKIEGIESAYSKATWDRPKALAYSVSDGAVKYLTDWPRVRKLSKEIDTLVAKIPAVGETLVAIKNEIIDQLSNHLRIDLVAKGGLAIARRLRGVWEKFKPTDSLNALYDSIVEDQYRLVRLLSKRTSGTLQEFQKLPLGDKVKALENGWNQLAKDSGLEKEIYTSNEQVYIAEKEDLLRNTVESLQGKEKLSAAEVTAALDSSFGPALNDMGRPYEVAIDGLKTKVDADGKRSYEGVDKWLSDSPKKKLVGNAFRETTNLYNQITPEQLTKENQGKPITNLEDYKKHVSDRLRAQIVEQIKDQDLTGGLNVVSKARTGQNAPNFIVHINDKKQIELEINDQWAQESFQKIGQAAALEAAKPAKKPGKSPSTPKSTPKKPSTPEPEQYV